MVSKNYQNLCTILLKVLISNGSKLMPSIFDKKLLIEKWIESGITLHEVSSDGSEWSGISKRIGNLMGSISLPLIAANIINTFTFGNCMDCISMIPLVSDRTFIGMVFVFKSFGVQALNKIKPMKKIVSQGIHYIRLGKLEQATLISCSTLFPPNECPV